MANGNQQPTFAGQKVSPAMARAVSAFSASLEAEGQRRSRMGLSGAGFAAGFKEAVSPITDYSDMLEGNAAPGTVLFDAAMKSAEDKNKKLESRGVASLQVDEKDEEVGGVPDLLARPVETEEADVVPNTIRQAVQEGLQEGVEQTGPPRPVLRDNPGYSMNMMASLKRYSPQTFEEVVAMASNFGPGEVGPLDQGFTKPVSLLSPDVTVQITEEEAMQRKEISRADPNSLPEAMQPTGVGDTAYRSIGQASGAGLAPMPGTPFTPGQSVGGRAVPAR